MKRNNEPQEWQQGQAKARAARVLVAEQVAAIVVERDMTGSAQGFSRRVREVAEAQLEGDPAVLRAAVMEAALAALAWCVALDLRRGAR